MKGTFVSLFSPSHVYGRINVTMVPSTLIPVNIEFINQGEFRNGESESFKMEVHGPTYKGMTDFQTLYIPSFEIVNGKIFGYYMTIFPVDMGTYTLDV